MKTLALGLALVVLTGCGAPSVSINRAEFAIMYSDIKAQATVWLMRLQEGCAQKKLSAATCADLPSVVVGLKLLDDQAKAILRQADKDVDWATLGKYAEVAIGLAAKAAL